MSLTRYVYVYCPGRLANQLLAWANGRWVTESLADRTLLMDYAPLAHACTMPRTEFVQKLGSELLISDWPKFGTAMLAYAGLHCWWTESWQNHPPPEAAVNYLREIAFNPELIAQADSLIAGKPVIGVHIRYGDYVKIDPANPPLVRPPFIRHANGYYTEHLNALRAAFPGWPVFLATDGTNSEVRWFTDAYGPLRHPKNDGVLDFLTLARCRIIIASASTFAPTAAAIGNVPCIHPETGPQILPQLIHRAATQTPTL